MTNGGGTGHHTEPKKKPAAKKSMATVKSKKMVPAKLKGEAKTATSGK